MTRFARRSPHRPNDGPNDRLVDVAIVIGFAVVVALSLWRHEPWRDELQAWMIARASHTPGDLVRNLRHEGHPVGWYLMLWPAARVSGGIWMLQVVTWCVSVSTAGLVMARAPWSRFTRAILIFSYFFAFEYGVLARSYVLGTLCLLGALTSMRPIYRWFPLGIALGALTLTSAFGALIAFALFAGALVDQRAELRSLEVRRRMSATAALLFRATIVSWVQARPAPSTAVFNSWNFSLDADIASTSVAAIFRGIVPLPKLQRSWWNTSIADGHTGIAAVVGILAFIGILWALRRSRAAQTVWALGVVFIVALLYLKLRQADAARYYGHIFMVLVTAVWMHATPRDHAAEQLLELANSNIVTLGNASIPVTDTPHRAPAWFAAILVGQTAFGLIALAVDATQPFSDAQATAAWITAHGGNRPGIVGCDDAPASSVAGHLNRRIFYRQGASNGTFIEWNRQRNDDFADLATAVRRSNPGKHSRVFYVANEPNIALSEQLRFQSDNGIVADEHYWVYDLTDLTGAELTALTQRAPRDPCQTL